MGSNESKLVKEAERAENAKVVQDFQRDFAQFIQEAVVYDETSRQSLKLHAILQKFKQECPRYNLSNYSKGSGLQHLVHLVTEALGDCVMVKANRSFPPDVWLKEGSSCHTRLAYEQFFERYYEGAVIMHTSWRVTDKHLMDL